MIEAANVATKTPLGRIPINGNTVILNRYDYHLVVDNVVDVVLLSEHTIDHLEEQNINLQYQHQTNVYHCHYYLVKEVIMINKMVIV